MKKVLALLAVLSPAWGFAQITLNQAGYPSSVLGTDSLKVTTATSAFPTFAPLAGGTWDLSTVIDSTPNFFSYRIHGIAGYQFADSELFLLGNFVYKGNIQSNISMSEINKYSSTIAKSVYSLTFLTAGLNDSLVIDSQTVVYSSPRTKIPFPCTYNSSWSSNYVADLGIHLTFLVNGDTSAPGIVRTYTTEKDSVTGWGKMRVLDAAGVPSAYLSVLQVQTRITHMDSFFLKGVPFNGSLLAILGVTQGQKDTVYQQNYYRVGELTPLAQVNFHDAGYTQPYKATTHVQRLSTVGIEALKEEKELNIYPNPLSGRTITLELPQQGISWSYRITDMAGRCAAAGTLQGSGNIHSVQVAADMIPGMYLVHVYGENGAIVSRIVEIR